jgi:hypothetical protein
VSSAGPCFDPATFNSGSIRFASSSSSSSSKQVHQAAIPTAPADVDPATDAVQGDGAASPLQWSITIGKDSSSFKAESSAVTIAPGSSAVRGKHRFWRHLLS